MNIIYVIDNNYAEMAKLSIASVLKFNPQARIIIVSEEPIDIGYENITFDLSKYNWRHRPDDRFGDSVYLKLFLPRLHNILKIDRAIYIDADVLCQDSLQELWEMHCDYINAVESHLNARNQLELLNIKQYAFTGMMLMNLEAMHNDCFLNKCFEVMWNIEVPLWCHDETIINYAFNNKITFIDKKWNYCINRKYENPIPIKEVKLLHFVNKEKLKMADYAKDNNLV